MRINIVCRENGVGLTQDRLLVTEILQSLGHEVNFSDFAKKNINIAEKFHMNIFLELVHPKWFAQSTLNWLIPNPEWYDLRWRQYAPKFHNIVCKTKAGFNAFSTLNRRTSYTSFTSFDCYRPEIIKKPDRWLHVAGRSLQKATNMVFDLWSKHPELPHLTIVQSPDKKKPRPELSNLTYIYDIVSEKDLRVLQNECLVHVCPSETEGFGHYIVEAMSCKAIVITTTAPPMNELVTPDRGILCRYDKKSRQRLSTNYYVTEETLLKGIQEFLELDRKRITSMGELAREFYISNDLFFRKSFSELINSAATKHSTNSMLEARRIPKYHSRTNSTR